MKPAARRLPIKRRSCRVPGNAPERFWLRMRSWRRFWAPQQFVLRVFMSMAGSRSVLSFLA